MTKRGRRLTAIALTILASAASMSLKVSAQVRFSDLDAQINPVLRQHSANTVLPNQNAARANIDTRISQLSAQVQIAQGRRWLSDWQARDLRMQLDMIKAMESRYHDLGLTAAETQDLLGRLRHVANNVNQAIAESTSKDHRYARIIRGNPNDMNNLENQRLYLGSRIDEAIRLGRLSPAEAMTYKSELQRIGSTEQYIVRSKGQPTGADEERLRNMLHALGSKVNKLF